MKPNDYAKYAPASIPKKNLTVIEQADAAVNILEVYNAMGNRAPYAMFSSYKIDCPFSYEHTDGGLDKNCRIYPPTNIYCFAAHGVMTPTSLYARWKAMSRSRAAIILLEERGLLKNKSYREQWNDLIELREENRVANTKLGDPTYAVEALQTAMHNNAAYSVVEYTDHVREAWKVVLAILDILWTREDTDYEKINVWFERSLQKLNRAVEEAVNG